MLWDVVNTRTGYDESTSPSLYIVSLVVSFRCSGISIFDGRVFFVPVELAGKVVAWWLADKSNVSSNCH